MQQEITKEFRQKVQATQEIQQKARETHDNLQDIVRQQAQLNQRYASGDHAEA